MTSLIQRKNFTRGAEKNNNEIIRAEKNCKQDRNVQITPGMLFQGRKTTNHSRDVRTCQVCQEQKVL